MFSFRSFKGIVFSVLLIIFFLIFSYLFEDKKISRKVLHIGVSNWFFIYRYCFTGWFWPVTGLVCFAIINFFVELSKDKPRNWGTVCYPLSVVACIVASEFGFGDVTCTGCALLGMGYGDGLAAIVGIKFGKKKMPFSEKTVIGSLTVFIVVSAVVLIASSSSVWIALVVGLAAAVFECYTKGFWDNVSMPLVIYMLVALLV